MAMSDYEEDAPAEEGMKDYDKEFEGTVAESGNPIRTDGGVMRREQQMYAAPEDDYVDQIVGAETVEDHPSGRTVTRYTMEDGSAFTVGVREDGVINIGIPNDTDTEAHGVYRQFTAPDYDGDSIFQTTGAGTGWQEDWSATIEENAAYMAATVDAEDVVEASRYPTGRWFEKGGVVFVGTPTPSVEQVPDPAQEMWDQVRDATMGAVFQ